MSFNLGTATTENHKRQGFTDNRRSFRRKNQQQPNNITTSNQSTNINRPRQNINITNGTTNFNNKRLNNTSSNQQQQHNLSGNNGSGTKRYPKTRPPRSSNSKRNATNDPHKECVDSVGIEQSEYEDKEKVVIPPQHAQQLQSYTIDEINLIGPVFDHPELLGFVSKQRQSPRRPIPAYLLPHPRLLVTPIFHMNEWDKANQAKMLQIEASNSGNDFQGIYELFQKMREVERTKMEELGLVDAEHTAKDLNDAIAFQGSCLDMCPTFERVRRALENNVKNFEKNPQTNRIDRSRAVKAFSRPAAGQPPPLPSDVRPPHILKDTLDYLVDNVVNQLPDGHSFLWDRTRSIRQDFTYQNFYGPEAIDCNERIVRIHLLSLHIMAGSDVEYSQQQELEQFNKALQTLIEIYDDIRNHGGKAPNEAEFRAYYLLSHLRDPEIEREILSLPEDIMLDSNVQLALYFRSITSQNNIVERGHINAPGASNLFYDFFNVIYSEKTPLLMACLMETHFNEIRFYALKSMSRSYHSKSKKYPAHQLKDLLGFDTIENLIKFVTYYDIDVGFDNGVQEVDLFNKEKLQSKYKLNSLSEKARMAQPYSPQLDSKISGRPMSFFINSGYLNVDLGLKQPQERPILRTEIKLAIKSSATPIPSLNTLESVQPAGGFGSNSGGFNTAPSALFFKNNNVPTSQTTSISSTFAGNNRIVSDNSSTLGSNSLANNKFLFGVPSQKPLTNLPDNIARGVSVKESTVPTFHKPESGTLKSSSDSERISLPTFTQLISSSGRSEPSISKLLIPTTSNKLELNPQVSMKVKAIPLSFANSVKDSKQNHKLVDNLRFKEATLAFLNDLIEDIVTKLLSELIPKIIAYDNNKCERDLIIQTLSKELLSAFVSEFTYEQLLNSLADYHYSAHVRKRAIRKIIVVGQKARTKQLYQRKKLDELSSVSFRGRLTKPTRPFSDSSANSSLSSIASYSTSTHNRKRQRVVSTYDLSSRKKAVRDLWDPLDLGMFLAECSHNVKLGIERHEISLKYLLVVEDWSTPYSKWLKNKLLLKPNLQKNIYENCLSDGKLEINIVSLPGKEKLTNDFFINAGFMLFECGMVSNNEDSTTSIKKKLEHDTKVLAKLIQMITQFGYYKVQIVILYWNNSNENLSSDEAREILKLNDYSGGDIIKEIVFCDMTKPNGNVNAELCEAFSILGSKFRGELTPRGIKKRQKIKHIKEADSESTTTIPAPLSNSQPTTTDRFKEREEQALKQGKLRRKYGYLQAYARTNTGDDSFNRSMNRTVNNNSTSTFMNLLNSRYNTSTSMINALGISNTSILKGIGYGIELESTPVSSPKPDHDKNVGFIKPTVPKQIQQLHSLTAGILAKYKKH